MPIYRMTSMVALRTPTPSADGDVQDPKLPDRKAETASNPVNSNKK
jgi:hypothetical protein